MRSVFRLWVLIIGLISSAAFANAPEPPPLKAYGMLPLIEDMSISPAGNLTAAATRLKGSRAVLVIYAAGKTLMNVPLGDMKLVNLEWAGNDFLLVHVRHTADLGPGFTTDKHNVINTVILNIPKVATEVVFKPTPRIANVVQGNYGRRLTGGRWHAYLGGVALKNSMRDSDYYFDHGRTTLYSVELAKNKARKVASAASRGHWRKWLINQDGAIGATIDVTHSSGKWTLENADHKTIAEGSQPDGNIALLFFGKDGTSVIYSIEDDTAGNIRWFEVPLVGGNAKEILADKTVDRSYVDPTNGRFMGYRENGSDGNIVLFDPIKQNVLKKVFRAFRGLNVQVHDWTPSFSHVLVNVSGSGESGTWYTIDVVNGRANPVGYDRPGILSRHVGPISKFEYTASDGLEMDGILTLPPGREAKNLPLVMMPHGGPFGVRDREAFDWLAQAFTSRGYAVFQPNFRGSSGRELGFEKAGYGQWGRKMQSDISDGLYALAKKEIIDPARACIVGASYGGYAALAGVTLQQGLYRCAVAIAPVSDINELYRTDYAESGQSKMLRRNQRELFGDPAGFSEVSPRKHADKADAPILIIHGEDDTRVQLEQSTRMVRALKKAGKPHQFIKMKEEDHWLSSDKTRMQALSESLQFVQKWNPAASPDKAP